MHRVHFSNIVWLVALSTVANWGIPAIAAAGQDPIEDRVTHGYADSNGVKIHYAALGDETDPLVVMLHGFPDYWYTWRHQMEALAADHYVVAVDLRGYNRSDKPEGVANYAMRLLIGDVVAVIRHHERDKAIIVGHDWGGAIAWQFAMNVPQMTERLIVCNIPHPAGLTRAFNTGTEQQERSTYAANFQKEGAHESLTAEGLAGWVSDDDARANYIEAFERSDFEAMLNYYKANFPRVSAASNSNAAPPTPPAAVPPVRKVQTPVLMIHGMEDPVFVHAALNDTWEWIDNEFTLVTIPGAGHFVQQDAADRVTREMVGWLKRTD